MKIQTAKTNLLSKSLTDFGIIKPATRTCLYQITSQFAHWLSREIHQREGLFVPPQNLIGSINHSLRLALTSPNSDQEKSLTGLFVLHLQEDLFADRPDLTDEKLALLVIKSGFFAKFQDWLVLEGIKEIDLIRIARVYEINHKDLARANLYYKEAVRRYEKNNGVSPAAYLEALQALCRNEPENPEWAAKFRAAEASVLEPVSTLPFPIIIAPLAQERMWGNIKENAGKYLSGDHSIDACIYIFCRLANEEDREILNEALPNKLISEWKRTSEQDLLFDTFLRFMTTDDFIEITRVLDSPEKQQLYTPLTLVRKMKKREFIPQLLKIAYYNEDIINGYRTYAEEILLELFTHDDLNLLFDLLPGRHYELARQGILKVLTLADRDEILRRLDNPARDYCLSTYLLGLAKIGRHKDITLVLPYLGRERNIAKACARVISAQAVNEDLPLIKKMQNHVSLEVRAEAVYALFRLGSPLAMEAGIAVHQQDNYQGGVVRNQIAELLIEHATPSDFNRLSALNWQIEKKLIKRGIIKKSSDFNQDRVAAMIYGGDLKEKEEFVSSITEEDILTDRFNLRKMLAMPYQAIVKVALRIIEKFKAEECFSDLLAAYRGVYQHDRHDPHKWGYQSALYDVATLSDLSDIESMLSDPHKEIRRSGVAIVRKLKAWQLIPKIRPLAKDGDSFAKNALLRFSAEYADWDTVNRFLADNNSYVRQEAREAFAKIADPERNLNLLSAMLKDENKHKRTAAAYALAHLLKDKAEVEIPLPDGTGQVALGYYQARSTPPTISQMLDAARELLGSPKEEVVAPPTSQEDQKEALDLDSITDLLMHKEQSYRIAGVAAAIRLGDASLLPLVKARLSEFEQKTYIDEVKAATRIIMGFVAQHGSRDDLPFIERYMEMPGAIEAFVVHADAREVEKAKSWIKALNTDKERQGKAAIKLLCKLDHREALSDLMLNFENNSSVYNFYTELFGAIVHFEAKEEKPKIIKVLQKESGFYEKDKNAAIEALAALWEEEDLKKYQEAVAEGKIKRTEYTAYFRVLQARAPKIALMLARKKLREIMTGSGYLWNGGLSIEILKELGTREDLPMLFDQLSHPDEKIQKPCAEAVWGIGVRL